MITDAYLRVSDSQVVTASAVSTNTIDLSVARDIGEGEELCFNFAVTEAALAAGAATVEFQVIVSDSAALTSPVVVGSSGAIGKAALTLGANIVVRVNPQIASLGKRYLGANYVVSTGPLTAGKFIADVVADIQDGKKSYASGFTVV